MPNCTRREILLAAVAGAIHVAMSPVLVLASDACGVDHPFAPPRMDYSGQCPNCGMVRSMWARTWFEFENSEGRSQACSFHCLADRAIKSGEDPKNVKVALYMNPKEMVPAERAFFVVGASAKGTMTKKSKIAWPSKEEAENFCRSCGGEVVGFRQALTMAKAGIAQENPMLVEKRIKKGVIVEPVDNQDHCSVCNMYPARYPRHKCQMITTAKERYHFCSTQCLFEFFDHSRKYLKKNAAPFRIWVVDFQTGLWISAKTAYYVVGSGQLGPMGREAIVFDKKKAAGDFARRKGGQVLAFDRVTIAAIGP